MIEVFFLKLQSLVSKDHQQLYPFCCIVQYNLQFYVKIDPSSDRVFSHFAAWLVYTQKKQNQILVQVAKKKTNKQKNPLLK